MTKEQRHDEYRKGVSKRRRGYLCCAEVAFAKELRSRLMGWLRIFFTAIVLCAEKHMDQRFGRVER